MKPITKYTVVLLGAFAASSANAAIITFDDAIAGATSYAFDGDGDSVDDVVFSTTDPFGFNTAGPGANQSYIGEPGLEGTTTLAPDLRVDFLNGASGSLRFGFAMSLLTGLVDGVDFSVYDASGGLLASTNVLADFTLVGGVTQSNFPEGLVDVSFAGVASYALFDFSSNIAPRYIIDNFEGTFGSSETIDNGVPVPAPLALLGVGLAGLAARKRRSAER